MGISGCGASLASLMSAPPAAHAGWGRRRCRGAASGVGGCSRDSWQCAASAICQGQEPGWELGIQGTDLGCSVSCKALGWEQIGNTTWLSDSMICTMSPLPWLQKLLVAPSTAKRVKNPHDAYSGLRKPGPWVQTELGRFTCVYALHPLRAAVPSPILGAGWAPCSFPGQGHLCHLSCHTNLCRALWTPPFFPSAPVQPLHSKILYAEEMCSHYFQQDLCTVRLRSESVSEV